MKLARKRDPSAYSPALSTLRRRPPNGSLTTPLRAKLFVGIAAAYVSHQIQLASYDPPKTVPSLTSQKLQDVGFFDQAQADVFRDFLLSLLPKKAADQLGAYPVKLTSVFSDIRDAVSDAIYASEGTE
jgi:hypothetical protein